MNTKNLLLIIILTVATFSVFSTTRYSHTVYASPSNATTNSLNTGSNDNGSFPFNNLWNLNCADTTNHNSDDDAKTHDIHYERFADHKRKLIFCILGKVILIVSHLCSLLSICFHY